MISIDIVVERMVFQGILNVDDVDVDNYDAHVE